MLADADRLRQLMLHLLTNAMKFTPAGGRVTVLVRACEYGDVRIDVRDTGIGIRADMQTQVFEPFVQADPLQSRRQQGLGSGLAISREFARGIGR